MNNSSNRKLKQLFRQKRFFAIHTLSRFPFIFLSNKSFISVKHSNNIIIEKLFILEFEISSIYALKQIS
jgi:hypothetical protein